MDLVITMNNMFVYKEKNGVEDMPLCPKCKTKYRKGYTLCSDCNSPLVEKLVDDEMIPFFQAEEKIIAERLTQYFDFSGLESDIHYDEENQVYVVRIPAEKQMQAKKLYQAFYFVERERVEKECNQKNETSEDNNITESDTMDDSSNDINNRPPTLTEQLNNTEQSFTDYSQSEVAITEENNSDDEPATYVMKEEQYKDLSSTVWIFLFFGIAGTLVIILNLVGVFNFINGIIPNVVMGALFLFFLYVGISTNIKAKKVYSEIEHENKLTDEINHWLKNNVTDDFLASIHNNSISAELNYIKVTEKIHDMLIKEFGPQNNAYLDRLIEDYYSNTFDQNVDESIS